MTPEYLLKHWTIGLTGGIACGKSTIASIIRQNGFVVLDADALSRRIVEPGSEGLEAVIQAFGRHVLNEDGTMNRQKMRQIVFQQPESRQLLESIIHPRLQAEVHKELNARAFFQNPHIWFYEAALLFERQREQEFRAVWAAFCPYELQISRIMQRDHCDRSLAEAIIAAQMPAALKAQKADQVIDTDCSLDQLETRVRTALDALKRAIPNS